MSQQAIETQPWDVVDHLKTEEDMIAYLDAALEDGDPALIVAALEDIARAKSSEVAQFAKLRYGVAPRWPNDSNSLAPLPPRPIRPAP